MRHRIEKSPRDGTAIILGDDRRGTYAVAHWSTEARKWVSENGEPTKLTPTHWYPMPRDQCLLQKDEGSRNQSLAGRGRRLAASSITVTFVAAALIVTHFRTEVAAYVTRYAGQVAADEAGAPAEAQQASQVQQIVVVPVPEAQQSPNKDRAEASALEPTEARPSIGGLDVQPQAEAAKSAGSLKEEREKAATLAPEAAARKELAASAEQLRRALGEEQQRIAVLARELIASTEQHRRVLAEERARRVALWSELATVQRENEKQAALLKASDEAVRLKQAEAARSARSLEEEREKAAALALEAATARNELAASMEQSRQALEEERARGGAPARDLATGQRENEKRTVLLKTARLEQPEAARSARLLEEERKKATALALQAAAARNELAASVEKSRQALEEERARGVALARDLATAQRENEKQAALLKASDETARLKQPEAARTARSLEEERKKAAALALEATAARNELAASTEQSRQALEQERARGVALARDLATAQRENEKQAALLKASDETARLKQPEAAKNARSLEEEREKAAALALQAAAARNALAANTEQSRQALEAERARGIALARELATAQRENEVKAAQLRQAGEETAQIKRATESITAELRQSLQQERDRTEAMARNLESARRTVGARVMPEPVASSPISKTAQAVVVAMAQPTVGVQGSPEATRLVARASALLSQGDIGAARTVLERAVETGSAQASFMLAETYDPGILSAWGTYGTRGEVTKARELYAKAQAGGIQEAKDRLSALRQ